MDNIQGRNKIRAYALQDEGLDTIQANHHLGFPTDVRDYSLASQILKDMSIQSINLLTNNPLKVSSLESNGLKVSKVTSIQSTPNECNTTYLFTKKEKLGHTLQ